MFGGEKLPKRTLWVAVPHPVEFSLTSFISVYLLHAYDYCPEDPLICLCLAIASFGRAMQRQADNRNHLITQVNSMHWVHGCYL